MPTSSSSSVATFPWQRRGADRNRSIRRRRDALVKYNNNNNNNNNDDDDDMSNAPPPPERMYADAWKGPRL